MTKKKEPRRITKRVVDGLGLNEIAWDTDVRGFGVRRQRKYKTYILKTRIYGMQRWFSIGQHGAPWTPEMARKRAVTILGDIADGNDPAESRENAKADVTVSQLCDLYLEEGCVTKKASTLVSDRGRIKRHIKPLLGHKRVRAVTKSDITRLLNDVASGKTAMDAKAGKGRSIVRGGKGVATKCVTLISATFEFAIERGITAINPARGVKKFKDKSNERYLSAKELSRLGRALIDAEEKGEHPSAVNAIRLLVLSGCRKSEILTLCRDWVDIEHSCLRLPDSKTGQKVVQLGAPALELLATIPEEDGNPYVLTGHRKGHHFVGLQKAWERIRASAKLPNVRIHDLRHSYAAVGAAGGDSLLVIGALLGHRDQTTTSRYAHMTDDPVKAAADRISTTIAAAMEARDEGAEVVDLRASHDG